MDSYTQMLTIHFFGSSLNELNARAGESCVYCPHKSVLAAQKFLQGTLQPEVLCTSAWCDGIWKIWDSELVFFCTLHFANVLRVTEDDFPRAARQIAQLVLMTYLRRRRAQRVNFRTLHFARCTWRMCDQTGYRSRNSPTLHFATVTRVLFPSTR